MQTAFAIIAALTLVSAIAAMSFRNLVHCALSLAVAFAGLAALYLQLGAPFVGWAQVLVYIGAVAILIVFAILLTRSSETTPQPVISKSWVAGIAVAVLVFGMLTTAILSSPVPMRFPPRNKPEPKVHKIGTQLMTRYVLPLEAIGLLLTAAAIGAVIIAMHEKTGGKNTESSNGAMPHTANTPFKPEAKNLEAVNH